MTLRPSTDLEARRVIHASLAPVWVFRFSPEQSRFLDETIVWSDILGIPPVSRSWLYTQTLVAAYLLDGRSRRPRLNRKVFLAHLTPYLEGDVDSRETVADYRDFLQRELIYKEPS